MACIERARDVVVEPFYCGLIFLQAKLLAGFKVDYSAVAIQFRAVVDIEVDSRELDNHGVWEIRCCALDVEHDVREIVPTRHFEPISKVSKTD